MSSERTPLLISSAGTGSDGERVELSDFDDEGRSANSRKPAAPDAPHGNSDGLPSYEKKSSFLDNFMVLPSRSDNAPASAASVRDSLGKPEAENNQNDSASSGNDDNDDSSSESSSSSEEEIEEAPTKKRFVYRDIDDDDEEDDDPENNNNNNNNNKTSTIGAAITSAAGADEGSSFSPEPDGIEEGDNNADNGDSSSPKFVGKDKKRKNRISTYDAIAVYVGSLVVHAMPGLYLAGALLENNLFGLLYLSIFVSSCLIPRDMVQVETHLKKVRHHHHHHHHHSERGRAADNLTTQSTLQPDDAATPLREQQHSRGDESQVILRKHTSVFIALRPKSWLLALSMVSSIAAMASIAGYQIACFYDSDLAINRSDNLSSSAKAASSASSSSESVDYETWQILGLAQDTCSISSTVSHAWISLIIFISSAFSFVFVKRTGLHAVSPRLYGKWPVKYSPSNVVIQIMRYCGDDWLLCIAAGILTIFRQCIISLPFLLLFSKFIWGHLPSGLISQRVVFSKLVYQLTLLYTSGVLFVYFTCFALTAINAYSPHRETFKTIAAFEQPTISDAPHFLVIGAFLWALAHGCSLQLRVDVGYGGSAADATSKGAAANSAPNRNRRWEKLRWNLLRLGFHSWELSNAALLFLTLNVAPSALGFLWSALWTCTLSSGNNLVLNQLNMILGLAHFIGVAVVRVHGIIDRSSDLFDDMAYAGVEPRQSSSEVLSILLIVNIVLSTVAVFARRALQVNTSVISAGSLPSPRTSQRTLRRSDVGSARLRRSSRRRHGDAASLMRKAVSLGELAAVGLHRLLLDLARQYFYLVAFFALFLAAVVRVNVLHCAFTVLFAVNVLRKSFPQLLWILIAVYTITITHALYCVTAFFSESGTLDQIGFYAVNHDTWVLWPYYVWIAVFALQLRFTTAEKFVEISQSIRNYLVLAERVTISIIVIANLCLFAALCCTAAASVFGFVYLILFLASTVLVMNASSMHSPGLRLRRFWDFVVLPINALLVISCYVFQLSPETVGSFLTTILKSCNLTTVELGVTDTSFGSLWPKVVSLLLCVVQSRGWATNSAIVPVVAPLARSSPRVYGTAPASTSTAVTPRAGGVLRIGIAPISDTPLDANATSGTVSREWRLFAWLMLVAEKVVCLLAVYSLPLCISMLFVSSAVSSDSSTHRVSLLHLFYFTLALCVTLTEKVRKSVRFWHVVGWLTGLTCAVLYVLQLPSSDWANSEWLEYIGFPVKTQSLADQWSVLFPHILLFATTSAHVALCTAARDGLIGGASGLNTMLASPQADSPTNTDHFSPAIATRQSTGSGGVRDSDKFDVRSSMMSNRSSLRASLTLDASRIVRSLFDLFLNPTTYFRFAAFHLSVMSLFTAACSSISNVYGVIYFLMCCVVGYYGKQGMSTHYRWSIVSILVLALMLFQFAVRLGMPPGTSIGVDLSETYRSYFGINATTKEMLLTMVVWCAAAINRLSLQRHPLYRSFYGIMNLSPEMTLAERLTLKFDNIMLARKHNTLSYLYRLIPTPAGRHDFTKGDSLKDRLKLQLYTKFQIFVLLFMFLHAIYDATSSLTVLKVLSILIVINVLQNWHIMAWKGALWWKYVLRFHVLWMALRLVLFVPYAVCSKNLTCVFLYLGLQPSTTLSGHTLSPSCSMDYGCTGTPFGDVELAMHATVLALAWTQSVLYHRSEYSFVLHYLHRSDVVAKELGNAIRKSRKLVIDHMKAEVVRRASEREKLLRREMQRHKSVSCVGRRRRDDVLFSPKNDGMSSPPPEDDAEHSPNLEGSAPSAVPDSMTELALQHEQDRSMMVLGETLDYKAFALLAAIDDGDERHHRKAAASVLRRSATAQYNAESGSPLASPRTVMFDDVPMSSTVRCESPNVADPRNAQPRESRYAGDAETAPGAPAMAMREVQVAVLDTVDQIILWLDGRSLGHGATRITQKQLADSSRFGLLLLALYRFILTYTDKLCYLLFALFFGLSPCVLNAVLPISVFAYACVMNPRPHRSYWSFCLSYMQVLIVVKSSVKLAYCDNLSASALVGFTTSPWYGRVCVSDFFLIDLLILLMCVVSVFVHIAHLRHWGLWDDSELDTADHSKGDAAPLHHIVAGKLSDALHNVERDEIKTGTDLYRYQFACELISFIYIFFAYYKLVGSEDSLVNSLMQSLLPGSLAVALLLLFFFIVVDRIAYLKRNLQLKYALNVVYAIGYHGVMIWWFIHQTSFTQTYYRVSSFDLRGSLTVALFLYLLKSCYLFLSGLQVCRGLYSHLKHIVFTGNYGTLEFVMYMAARLTPFVFDMRVILDWTVMPTCLKMPYWIKLEDIAHELYLLLVDKVDTDDILQKNRGDRRKPYPTSLKLPLGIILFLFLTTILMFPLLLYSSFSPALQQNFIASSTATVSIESTPPLWQSSNKYSASQNMNRTATDMLERTRPGLVGLGLSTDTVQLLQMGNYSSTTWAMPPPATQELLRTLNGSDGQLAIVVTLEVRNGVASQAEASSSFLTQTRVLQPHEMRNLSLLLTGKVSRVLIEKFYSPFVFNKAPSSFTARTDYADFVDCFLTVFNSTDSGTLYFSVECRTLFMDGNPGLHWQFSQPEAVCWTSDLQCPNYENRPLGSVGALSPVYFVVVSSAVFTASLLQQIGIVAAYTTFVFAIGRVLRFAFVGGAFRTSLEDMEDPSYLVSLIEYMCIARAGGDYRLEMDIYTELVNTLRVTEELEWQTRAKSS